MLILSNPQTILGCSPDIQVELSEWATACFKHCAKTHKNAFDINIFSLFDTKKKLSQDQWVK